MIIGICGKSGSGKSTLARKISSLYNGKYIDIDRVGHLILTKEEVKCELVNSFGVNVVSECVVDRKKLGDLVFNSRDRMDNLTQITWKYMERKIDFLISSNLENIIVMDWILLPKTKYFDMCDKRILLDIPYEIRKQRAIIRDGISGEDFDLRDSASLDYNLGDFDYVFNDNEEVNIMKLVKSL